MKISKRLILGIIVTVMLVGVLGYICLHQFEKIAGPLNNEIPETVRIVSEASQLDGMAQFIRYYDEVLTQSARNYAFTQDKKWQQRYDEIAPKLDEIIKQAIESGDEQDKQFFSSVDKANLALVQMESESFEFTNNGQTPKAIEILQGSEYWAQKNIYEQGLRNYIGRKGLQYDETLKASTSQIESANSKAQDIIKRSTLLVFVFIGGALILSVLIGISNYYSILMPIKELKAVTVEIGAGHLETKIEIKSNNEIGELARDFATMLTGLKEARHKNETQDWLKTGQTGLNDQLRGEQETVTLCQNIITYIANYLNAQVGAVYLVEEKNDRLQLISGYAYTKSKDVPNSFAFGEGLVGQAAIKKESIHMVDVPEDYITVRSGLGKTLPRNIMLLPFLLKNEVVGVIELGSLDVFSELHIEFLHQVLEPVAIAVMAAKNRLKTQELLERTQAQSEELQNQQEELKATNEELEQQAEWLKNSEEQLQAQQQELEATNVQLEENAAILEEQRQEPRR